MLLSAPLATTFAAALALIVGTGIGLGHRYGDAKSKLLDKPKTDQLNEIRLAIRDEETIPILQNLWNFLDLVNQEMKKLSLALDVSSFKFDIERREKVNHLINEIFRSFKAEAGVKQCWDDLVQRYGNLGLTLYTFSAIAGLGGYTTISLGLTGLLDNFGLGATLTSIIITIVCGVLGFYSFALHLNIKNSLKLYQNAVKKYLTEVPRVT